MQLVILLEMAALPSRWFFLAAFPAVIWSLDCRRTLPELSGKNGDELGMAYWGGGLQEGGKQGVPL